MGAGGNKQPKRVSQKTKTKKRQKQNKTKQKPQTNKKPNQLAVQRHERSLGPKRTPAMAQRDLGQSEMDIYAQLSLEHDPGHCPTKAVCLGIALRPQWKGNLFVRVKSDSLPGAELAWFWVGLVDGSHQGTAAGPAWCFHRRLQAEKRRPKVVKAALFEHLLPLWASAVVFFFHCHSLVCFLFLLCTSCFFINPYTITCCLILLKLQVRQ